MFSALRDYKDSEAKFEELKQLLMSSAKVGDSIYFGKYEQDNNTSNGKEDIEWLVLAKDNKYFLLISKYALDCQPYNENKSVTWEKCTLRKWLNNDFINAAFSEAERAKIPTARVTADRNASYDTNPGNDTNDKIFLLSILEADQLFVSNSARQCKPTAYADLKGVWTKDNVHCDWWLRSPGVNDYNATFVSHGGGVSDYGIDITYKFSAVRLALFLNL